MGAARKLTSTDELTSTIRVAAVELHTTEDLRAWFEAKRQQHAGYRRPATPGRTFTDDELLARLEAKRLQQLGIPPSADPKHLRARGRAGETSPVFVRSSYPVGDWSLITCESYDDATRVYEFGSPGHVAQGCKGWVRYLGREHAKVQGWIFEGD